MLWDIRARMKPAFSVIDMIPNVHRTPALAALRRAVLDGRGYGQRLSAEEKSLAYHESAQILTSPIGARILKALYDAGQLKLKKPGPARLPTLEAYIATEAQFRAEVAEILAKEDAKRARLADILADPSLATADEITTALVEKLANQSLGHGVSGSVEIGGVTCHREIVAAIQDPNAAMRAEDRILIWWLGPNGERLGDPA